MPVGMRKPRTGPDNINFRYQDDEEELARLSLVGGTQSRETGQSTLFPMPRGKQRRTPEPGTDAPRLRVQDVLCLVVAGKWEKIHDLYRNQKMITPRVIHETWVQLLDHEAYEALEKIRETGIFDPAKATVGGRLFRGMSSERQLTVSGDPDNPRPWLPITMTPYLPQLEGGNGKVRVSYEDKRIVIEILQS